MIGRRLTATADEIPADYYGKLEPGDYLFLPSITAWYLKAPNGDEGTLMDRRIWANNGTGHTVNTEADETITVSPSIQMNTGKRWHGYLTKGIWSEAL